jgi:preprotein translocase subunit SecF
MSAQAWRRAGVKVRHRWLLTALRERGPTIGREVTWVAQAVGVVLIVTIYYIRLPSACRNPLRFAPSLHIHDVAIVFSLIRLQRAGLADRPLFLTLATVIGFSVQDKVIGS